jgi:uncharacterized RDD family membrane protein YckC
MPAGRSGEAAIQFSHSGHRYLLGYGADFFGIWDREAQDAPVKRFPRTDEGWAQAWREFAVLEPANVGVGLGGARGADGARRPEAGSEIEGALLRRLAAPWRRLLARVLDGLVLVGVALLISFLFFSSSADLKSNAQVVKFLVTFQIVAFVYEVVLIAIRGQTFGKAILRIRVVGITDGTVPGWAKAGIRWLLPAVASFVPVGALIVYIWLLWDPKRQGLHDKVAGTLVVQA